MVFLVISILLGVNLCLVSQNNIAINNLDGKVIEEKLQSIIDEGNLIVDIDMLKDDKTKTLADSALENNKRVFVKQNIHDKKELINIMENINFSMEEKNSDDFINNKSEGHSDLTYVGTVMEKLNGQIIYIDASVENIDEDFINASIYHALTSDKRRDLLIDSYEVVNESSALALDQWWSYIPKVGTSNDYYEDFVVYSTLQAYKAKIDSDTYFRYTGEYICEIESRDGEKFKFAHATLDLSERESHILHYAPNSISSINHVSFGFWPVANIKINTPEIDIDRVGGGMNSDYVKMRFTPSGLDKFEEKNLTFGVAFRSDDDSPYVFFNGGYEFTVIKNWKVKTISKKQATYLYTGP